MAYLSSSGDQAGIRLLTTSSSPHDNDDSVDQLPFRDVTDSILEDGSPDTAYLKTTIWRRLLSIITPTNGRRKWGSGGRSSEHANGLYSGHSKYGRRKGLKRCMSLGLGILVALGIIQLFTLLAGIYAGVYPDRFHSIIKSWKQIDRSGNGLSSWPTDITRDITPIPCHSHNDYWRPVPLYSAVSAGCISVEADVWLFDEFGDDLYVGHSTASLTRNRTLKNLYINPLVEILGKQNHATEFQPNATSPLHGIFDADPSQSLTLLIDFKSFGPDLWPRVIEQLEPLRSRNYLTYFNGTTVIPGPIIVVGTGNTPFDLLVSNTTYRDVFFDAPLDKMWEALERRDKGSPDDALLKNLGSTAAIKQSKGHARVGMRQVDRPQQDEDHPGDLGDTTNTVQDNNRTTNPTNPDIYTPENSYYASVSFGKAIGRLWRNQLSSHQMELIRGHIRGAHRRGLKVRYWDLPDWPIGWRNHVWDVLVEEGVDLLNVDDLEGAARRDWGRRDWWW